MRVPSNNDITLPFASTASPYSKGNPHRGTDFSYKPDDIIYAPFSGKIIQIPLNGNDGNGTYMIDDQGRYHGLLHASKYLVPDGSKVTEGQPIAVMGDTGYAIGKHLHWAVKHNGKFIDPMSLVTEGGDMAYISEEALKDFEKWKAIGIDAIKYKDALLASKAWKDDIKENLNNITPALDDLSQNKKDRAKDNNNVASKKLEEIKKIVG